MKGSTPRKTPAKGTVTSATGTGSASREDRRRQPQPSTSAVGDAAGVSASDTRGRHGSAAISSAEIHQEEAPTGETASSCTATAGLGTAIHGGKRKRDSSGTRVEGVAARGGKDTQEGAGRNPSGLPAKAARVEGEHPPDSPPEMTEEERAVQSILASVQGPDSGGRDPLEEALLDQILAGTDPQTGQVAEVSTELFNSIFSREERDGGGRVEGAGVSVGAALVQQTARLARQVSDRMALQMQKDLLAHALRQGGWQTERGETVRVTPTPTLLDLITPRKSTPESGGESTPSQSRDATTPLSGQAEVGPDGDGWRGRGATDYGEVVRKIILRSPPGDPSFTASDGQSPGGPRSSTPRSTPQGEQGPVRLVRVVTAGGGPLAHEPAEGEDGAYEADNPIDLTGSGEEEEEPRREERSPRGKGGAGVVPTRPREEDIRQVQLAEESRIVKVVETQAKTPRKDEGGSSPGISARDAETQEAGPLVGVATTDRPARNHQQEPDAQWGEGAQPEEPLEGGPPTLVPVILTDHGMMDDLDADLETAPPEGTAANVGSLQGYRIPKKPVQYQPIDFQSPPKVPKDKGVGKSSARAAEDEVRARAMSDRAQAQKRREEEEREREHPPKAKQGGGTRDPERDRDPHKGRKKDKEDKDKEDRRSHSRESEEKGGRKDKEDGDRRDDKGRKDRDKRGSRDKEDKEKKDSEREGKDKEEKDKERRDRKKDKEEKERKDKDKIRNGGTGIRKTERTKTRRRGIRRTRRKRRKRRGTGRIRRRGIGRRKRTEEGRRRGKNKKGDKGPGRRGQGLTEEAPEDGRGGSGKAVRP